MLTNEKGARIREALERHAKSCEELPAKPRPAQKLNPNSALIWLPAIEAAGLPVPKTVVIPYSHRDVMPIFDGEPSAEFERLVVEIASALESVGTPAFLRTDLSSAKHDGPKGYRIDSPGKIAIPLGLTLADSEVKFWLTESASALLLRKFLVLPAPFTAFHGLPISREFRLFADGAGVRCGPHPYWPAEAVAQFLDAGTPEDWRQKLSFFQQATPAEVEMLSALAVEAAKACGGEEWSVDLAQDEFGKWWLIDMATGPASYHWPECPRATA